MAAETDRRFLLFERAMHCAPPTMEWWEERSPEERKLLAEAINSLIDFGLIRERERAMTEAEREALIERAFKEVVARDAKGAGKMSSILACAAALIDAGLLREPVEWRPISEAPKDGTWIQLWRPIRDAPGTQEPLVYGRWFVDEDGEGAWCWPDTIYNAFSEQGRAEADEELAAGEMFHDNAFTHWQPLPPPPQEDSSNGR